MTGKETMIEQKVTYTLQTGDKFIIIRDVPARVCEETGERFFPLRLLKSFRISSGRKDNRQRSSKRLCMPLRHKFFQTICCSRFIR